MHRAVDTPGEVAAGFERGQPLPSGPGERYLGYGILGTRSCPALGHRAARTRAPVPASGGGAPAGGW